MNISEWWESYDTFAHVLWGMALVGSVLFLFQTASALLLGDSDSAFGDSDELVDTDTGVGYQFFTFRNAVTFFTMFGWIGLGFYTEGYGKWTSLGAGMLAGSAMVFAMAWLMKQIGSLKQDGSMKIENAVGKVGSVYLPIPGKNGGQGQVQLPIQGSTHELTAVTNDEEDLPTGTTVTVESIRPGGILVVSKLR